MNYSDRQLAIMRNRNGENIPVPPPPRKSPKSEESRIQKELIRWWELKHGFLGVPEKLLFSVPNGGQRSAITGARLKREGARAGVCDLFLSVPRRGAHGLYIEMKAPGEKPSPAQIEFMRDVQAFGYFAVVCDSLETAQYEIATYLTVK